MNALNFIKTLVRCRMKMELNIFLCSSTSKLFYYIIDQFGSIFMMIVMRLKALIN